jgi:signal transduction histidine kinase
MVAVQADRGAMFMLVKNLMENAIQHSPTSGMVAVTIDSDRISIRDEGPGIADDELPKLFTRFWRGSQRRNEGAGLGLSICKEIAAAHKWDLSAGSTGRGAEFILSLRVNPATKSTIVGHAPGRHSIPLRTDVRPNAPQIEPREDKTQ